MVFFLIELLIRISSVYLVGDLIMIKKSLFLTLVLCLASYTPVKGELTAQKQQNKLEHVIVATDLDDVLLEFDTYAFIYNIVISPFSFIHYKITCFTYAEPGKPAFLTCGEALYLSEVTKNGYENGAASFLRTMEQCKYIKPETLEVYQQLNDLGADFYTATNIGSTFFSDLQQNQPDIFHDDFIKHGLTVDYNAPIDNIIAKPNIEYFHRLKAKINPDNQKVAIFIDDKLKNVESARKAGFIGIHFQNAEQLKADLEQHLNINLSSN